ncbi:MAG: FAD-binding oxidoreductase [Tepidamorphaceae bacterium]
MQTASAPSDPLLSELRSIVGSAAVIADGDRSKYLVDARGWFSGAALAVVLPKTVEEVAAVVKLAAREGLKVIPQGGNTSMVYSSVPDDADCAIVVNLSRMNRIREIDREASVAVVDAGCVLASLHDAAAEVDRAFPLHLGSEGSAQIGGLAGANAGGTGALRYGNMRDLTLGLEVVLPNGEILSDLNGLRKDNRGYNLNHLFIGAEGTLGIITGAALKLVPQNRTNAAAFVALESPQAALELLGRVQDRFGTSVNAYELLSGNQIALCEEFTEAASPFETQPDWAVLIEISDPAPDAPLKDRLENLLGEEFEAGRLIDAVIAQNGAQSAAFWHLRHAVTEANVRAGYSTTLDASVRVSQVPEFITRCSEMMRAEFPGVHPLVVCHMGDGNVHFIALFRADEDEGADRQAVINRIQELGNGLTVEIGGSFSAEHGIGRKLTGELERLTDPARYATLKAVKMLFDPSGMMNPGVIFPEPGQA